ncbi:hypothetical protein BV25DRAFT_1677426 [Artomyces pyxidatus]|uniref:Uncharacterized protein n=1 Tax=Artomyces pyxidatus TaxID=48021 RepID=A0ACB8TB27_9AGAM|nr:hypothetical protein BV25DRAFT_1677426 [Artomyces pyxidatus]
MPTEVVSPSRVLSVANRQSMRTSSKSRTALHAYSAVHTYGNSPSRMRCTFMNVRSTSRLAPVIPFKQRALASWTSPRHGDASDGTCLDGRPGSGSPVLGPRPSRLPPALRRRGALCLDVLTTPACPAASWRVKNDSSMTRCASTARELPYATSARRLGSREGRGRSLERPPSYFPVRRGKADLLETAILGYKDGTLSVLRNLSSSQHLPPSFRSSPSPRVSVSLAFFSDTLLNSPSLDAKSPYALSP